MKCAQNGQCPVAAARVSALTPSARIRKLFNPDPVLRRSVAANDNILVKRSSGRVVGALSLSIGLLAAGLSFVL